MAEINYDDPIENLPDAFAKDKDSNNYKLLMLSVQSSDMQEAIFRKMFNSLDIDSAGGSNIDHIFGERIRLKRGGSNDLQYIMRLKAKIMQNTSDSSFPKIVEALAYIFQCEKSEIVLEASDSDNAIFVRNIPLDKIQAADFTPYQVLELIRRILAVNVKIGEYDIPITDEATIYYGAVTPIVHEMTVPSVVYNTYGDIKDMTYEELSGHTYREILEGGLT